jgi:hypothetical protein
MKKKNQEMIQSVIVTFKGGEKATFTGPAVVFQNEEKVVENIVFTAPKPLPQDCEWGKV